MAGLPVIIIIISFLALFIHYLLLVKLVRLETARRTVINMYKILQVTIERFKCVNQKRLRNQIINISNDVRNDALTYIE